MASFLRGFTKGFADAYSQGIEDENKNNRAIERDRDRVITENILRTATEFHKNYPKAVADTKKTFERYQTALQLTGGNQAAAEAIAKDHDIKLNDFDRIIPIIDAFKNNKDYKSTIPDETKAQYEALHRQGQQATNEANAILGKSKRLAGRTQAFSMPALDPSVYTAGNRPTIELPRNDPGLKAQQFIITHSERFANAEAAVQFVNARREDAGLPPLDMKTGSKMFAGVTFGSKEDTARFAQARQLAASEGLTGPALERRALEISLNQAPRGIALGSTDHRALQNAIVQDVNRIAGGQFVPDPMTPGSFTFKFAKPEQGEIAMRAAVTAQRMLEADLANAQRPRSIMEYVYAAANMDEHRLVSPGKELPVIKPLPGSVPMNTSAQPNPQGTPAQGGKPAVTPPAIPDPQAKKPTAGSDKPNVWKEGEIRPALKGNPWGLPENTELKNEGGQIWANINGKWVKPPEPKGK